MIIRVVLVECYATSCSCSSEIHCPSTLVRGRRRWQSSKNLSCVVSSPQLETLSLSKRINQGAEVYFRTWMCSDISDCSQPRPSLISRPFRSQVRRDFALAHLDKKNCGSPSFLYVHWTSPARVSGSLLCSFHF